MKCLILAAGKGSRLQHRTDSKPLLPLLGVPLIERVVRTAMAAGADAFVVVIGNQSDKLGVFLSDLARRLDVSIETVVNQAWETTENGHSVLAAREHLREPFLLLMADHLFDPELAIVLLSQALPMDGIALAVDGEIHNPLADINDVTRVQHQNGQIVLIGKDLKIFNGLDTGVFHCSPALFDSLEKTVGQGDGSLSSAVRALAHEGQALAVDVTGRFWIDVDDTAAFHRAERAMLEQLRGKTNDGPVARWANRPLSIRLSRLLVQHSISPNQISLFSFTLSLMGAGLFASGGYPALALGGVLAQAASIIDGCDGEVARLKYMGSDYGGWLDAVLDRYADAFLLFGLTWHLLAEQYSDWVLFVGFMAVIGSFMLSYTADKHDNLMRKRIIATGKMALRLGRDVRVFLIFLAAITNLVLPALLLIALIMNLETVRRMIVVRHG